jgi:hypothetical protein
MSAYGPPEKVYVEIEYYDGVRAGVADVNGVPHRFVSPFEEWEKDDLAIFYLWPIDEAALDLEREQWRIFAEWNSLYEAGAVSGESHPGHTGMNARWAELDAMLKEGRSTIPVNARRARVQFPPLTRERRYESDGPCYSVHWLIQ